MKTDQISPRTQSSEMRLKLLRREMSKLRLKGYIVPRQDEFQGETVAAYAERLKWLTGFAGSWGLAIVAKGRAALFVDGRYTLQAKQQVDTRLIQPQHLTNEPPSAWIAGNFQRGDRIGFDPNLVTVASAGKLRAAAAGVGAKLVPIDVNLVDAIWRDQPRRPAGPVVAHPLTAAGIAAKHKLNDMVKTLTEAKADAVVLSDPASVAWVFNIRGSDVPYTPVVLAHAVVKQKGKAELFIDPARMTAGLRKSLAAIASLKKPEMFDKSLAALGQSKAVVLLDPSLAAEHVRLLLAAAGATIKEGHDPCALPRARKNKVECQGARDAQRRDGAALSRFLCWIGQEAPKGQLTERSAAEKLKSFRHETGVLKDLSFEAISAVGPNAASPHYHFEAGKEGQLKKGAIYLVDSGGQYIDGTTDVTRTVIIGAPKEEMRDRFTRVLKGMINISLLRFPVGTTGAHIDVLARASLWKAGLDFDHGTGHGVGSYLSVHEGPARISKTGHVALAPGMIISNEPGFYKPDHYGIRIENLLLVKEPEEIEGGDRAMLGFETLTLAPIDRALIDTRLLTHEELDWLDAYHARVLAEISPLVDAETGAWLKDVCASLK